MNYYEIWLTVIGTGFMFSFLFTFEPYGYFIENVVPYKPFNCVLCMTFWCSLIGYMLVGMNPFYSIYSAIIAEFTYRKLVNYE